MKAVVYRGVRRIELGEVEQPRLEDPRDCIVRVTSAAICGSDLHMYDGRTDIAEGAVLGHEILGVVSDIGSAVSAVRPGDRVVLPFNIACGFCESCTQGAYQACTTLNPGQPGAAYGYADMGPFRGGQAQFVRVPFADVNCIKLPGMPGDEFERDFVLLSDVLPTGFHATELAGVRPGSTVAIYGAGPVGLMAAMSALLCGAAEVYVVDQAAERLACAADLGAIPINFQDGNPAEQIKRLRAERRPAHGEEHVEGVMCGIDAVGYQALALDDSEDEQPGIVLEQLTELVAHTGAIGVVGVYFPRDEGARNDLAKHGRFALPLGKWFQKGLTVRAGQTPVKKYAERLRDLIVAKKIKPGFIVSHELPLEEAPKAYELFDLRGLGAGAPYIKVVLKPQS